VQSPSTTLGAALALLALLVVLPGGFNSPVGGPPLSTLGRALVIVIADLAVLLVVFRPHRQLPNICLAILGALIVVKLAASLFSVPQGWQGTYQLPESPPNTPAQFSRDYQIHPYRIDDAINFRGANFGLYFLNDSQRYGGLHSSIRRDVDLPLTVAWEGYLPSGIDAMDVTATANGNVRIVVDGIQYANLTNPTRDVVPIRGLGVSTHRVQIFYDKPGNQDPTVVVSLNRPTDNGAIQVTPQATSSTATQHGLIASVITSLVVGLGILIVVSLFILGFASIRRGAIRSRFGGSTPAGIGALLVFAGLSLVTAGAAWSLSGVTVSLSAGDDWLVYESNARDIMQQGLLMPYGSTPGKGSPYFFYPVYSYVLAGAHWLIGDDYGAVVLLNGLSVACLGPLFWSLGWQTLRRWPAFIAFGALGAFAAGLLMPYALRALADSLYIALVFASLGIAVWAVRVRTPLAFFCVGISSAITAATRPSFMTFLPLFVIACVLWFRAEPVSARAQLVIASSLGVAAGLAPFATRNYIMSGHFELLVNSWIQIPYFLSPLGAQSQVTGQPGLLESLRLAAGIIWANPSVTLLVELRKIAFSLGFTQLGPPGIRAQPWLIALSVLYLLSLALRRGPAHTTVVVGVFAASHVIAMVLAAPWSYGYKNILPLQAAFLFAAAYLFQQPSQRDTPPRRFGWGVSAVNDQATSRVGDDDVARA
jgi:hypothetical protein